MSPVQALIILAKLVEAATFAPQDEGGERYCAHYDDQPLSKLLDDISPEQIRQALQLARHLQRKT